MTFKQDFGFVLGLCAVIAFFSSVLFLIALLIVQPFQIQLVPRRMWMHHVGLDWLALSSAVFAVCVACLWHKSKRLPIPAESETQMDATTPVTPLSHHDSRNAVWVCPYGASPLGTRLDAQGDAAEQLDVLKRYQKGEAVDPSEFSKAFVLNGKTTPRDIMVSGFVFVSEDVARILRNVDMGQNQLIALEGLYPSDGQSKLEKTYFVLTLETRKTVFLDEASTPGAIRQTARGLPLWTLYVADCADGDIAVSAAALVGPDIWRDPTAPNFLFFSDRLKIALDQQGIGSSMGFKRCRVVR